MQHSPCCEMNHAVDRTPLPRHISDSIYSGFAGAQFNNNTANGPMWTLPCTTEVNATIRFGNTPYPIHPLDINFSFTDSSNSSEDQTCYGAVCNHTHSPCFPSLTIYSFNQLRLALRLIMTSFLAWHSVSIACPLLSRLGAEPSDQSTQRVSTHKLWRLRRRCNDKGFALRAAPVNHKSSFRPPGLY
jgi:hypothetical protein